MTEIELSSTGERLTVGLLTKLSNTAELRQRVMSGQLDCCLIKPSLVPSELVVATAANKACLARQRANMKTRSINTEILFNMSSSSNITDSLKRFGVDDAATEVLVAGVDKDLEEVKKTVDGEWVEMDLLPTFLDNKTLTKLHKLKPDELCDITGSLCSRISAKDCL